MKKFVLLFLLMIPCFELEAQTTQEVEKYLCQKWIPHAVEVEGRIYPATPELIKQYIVFKENRTGTTLQRDSPSSFIWKYEPQSHQLALKDTVSGKNILFEVVFISKDKFSVKDASSSKLSDMVFHYIPLVE